MHIVHYSRIRLGLFLVLCIVLFPVGLWLYDEFYGKLAFLGAILVVMGVLGIPKMLRYLVDNRVIGFDRNRITYYGMLGEKTISWSQLEGIEIEEISGSRHLKLNGSFGTLLAPRVSERMLGDGQTLETLIDLMERVSAGVEEPVRRAAPVPQYQAAPEPVAMPPRSAGFGRKGL